MDATSLANLRDALDDDASAAPDRDPFAKVWARANAFEGIWPENVAVVRAFLAVCSQWRVTPVSGGGMMTPAGNVIAPTVPLYIGLDYAAARAGLDAELIEVTPTLWQGLRVMEGEACKALNEDLK
ncbi:DUF1799 domain-containing protein [Bradyrhizobium sp. 191]|uniref:DUF1799 domain-containing protein n=1 Tax=Bradyrhizobium sp. 191 TaxID=2782659 RepID=UPI001FFF16C6|nr:DUF1799 domain-containing protein [Bradyrhizobium sp. 191]UPJ65228.1 DUF1799 domain-containing protein [Bradyrhizobium sp. 191]